MTDWIRKIVAELPGMESVTGVWAEADGRLAQGDAAFCADLGIALAEAYGSGGNGNGDDGNDGGDASGGPGETVWQYRSVFDHLLRLLATTPGPGHVAHALRLVSAAEAAGRGLDRYAASLLASGQPSGELAAAFTGDGTAPAASEELRACLVHELVLRGVAVAGTPEIAEWATSSRRSRHPLDWLPLTLRAVEGRPDLPSHGTRGSSHAMPYGPSGDRGVPAAAPGRVPAAEETTTDAGAARMAAAVRNWADESNGRVEARVFRLAGPLDADAVPQALLSLGLECLRAPTEPPPFSAVACPPSRAWRVLFAAASTGGAYGSGAGGAYGRLAAWQSLAGLSGAAEGAGAAEVEACARECGWYSFDAGTEWFEQVAWDIGLAAVAADGRRLAVLAATDTD